MISFRRHLVQSNVQNKEEFRLEGKPFVSAVQCFKIDWPQAHLAENVSFVL